MVLLNNYVFQALKGDCQIQRLKLHYNLQCYNVSKYLPIPLSMELQIAIWIKSRRVYVLHDRKSRRNDIPPSWKNSVGIFTSLRLSLFQYLDDLNNPMLLPDIINILVIHLLKFRQSFLIFFTEEILNDNPVIDSLPFQFLVVEDENKWKVDQSYDPRIILVPQIHIGSRGYLKETMDLLNGRLIKVIKYLLASFFL